MGLLGNLIRRHYQPYRRLLCLVMKTAFRIRTPVHYAAPSTESLVPLEDLRLASLLLRLLGAGIGRGLECVILSYGCLTDGACRSATGNAFEYHELKVASRGLCKSHE